MVNNNYYRGFNIDSNNKREKRIFEDFNPFGYNYLINKKSMVDDCQIYSKTCQTKAAKKPVKK
ncbi:MAG: hypothetical protein IJO33_02585 [Bacilli bacterium]|nr:hypothetical protein [Bacilli bacterium]